MAHTQPKSFSYHAIGYFWITVGAFLAAFAIRIFLLPNHLIDGGVVGIALILAQILGQKYLSYYLVILNLPFIYLAYRFIRRTFVLHMFVAIMLFAGFLWLTNFFPKFEADPIEIIVIGGAILGIGLGLIIRSGGCIDGTEILAIIINRKKGFTVGQVVLVINVVVFVAYGCVTLNWHYALQSLLVYIVAFKMMDLVIMGLDELKSVLIISAKPQELSEIITRELGLGLTVMYGRGGFTGDKRELLFIIIERLDLSELKEIVLREDPTAFMVIENLYEVANLKHAKLPYKKSKWRNPFSPPKF